MLWAIGALIIEAVALIFFIPIKFGVKYHFSLGREYTVVLLTVLGVRVALLKVGLEEGKIKVTLNGKPLPKRKRESAKDKPKEPKKGKSPDIVKLIRFTLDERLISIAYAVGSIGGEDAMSCALRLGALNAFLDMLPERIYPQKRRQVLLLPDFDNDRLDFDLNGKISINLTQFFSLLKMAKG